MWRTQLLCSVGALATASQPCSCQWYLGLIKSAGCILHDVEITLGQGAKQRCKSSIGIGSTAVRQLPVYVDAHFLISLNAL